jgi:hypothetical protein
MSLNVSVTLTVLFNVDNDMMVVSVYNTVIEEAGKKLYHSPYGLASI